MVKILHELLLLILLVLNLLILLEMNYDLYQNKNVENNISNSKKQSGFFPHDFKKHSIGGLLSCVILQNFRKGLHRLRCRSPTCHVLVWPNFFMLISIFKISRFHNNRQALCLAVFSCIISIFIYNT